MSFVSVTEFEEMYVIRMDDGKANAMGFQMLSELDVALDKSISDCKAAILTGRKGLLSGGFDLKIIREGTQDQVSELVSEGVRVLMKLFGLPIPLIVVVPGHAVALGGFLTLVGDYRIGLQGDYKIGLNETAIGLTLPSWGLELVNVRLNTRYITRSAVNAELFSPEEAIQVGFLDEVTTEEKLETTAFTIGRKFTTFDMSVFHKNKLALRRELIRRVLGHHD